MSGAIPDFSPLAAADARSRPRYPDALFDFLAPLVASHRLAWECATSSGQAALAPNISHETESSKLSAEAGQVQPIC